MTPEQVEDVRVEIWAEPWKDPQLFPDLLHRVVTELGQVATGEPVRSKLRPQDTYYNSVYADWAADLLRTLQQRAKGGIPFGEPSYGDLGPTNPKDA